MGNQHKVITPHGFWICSRADLYKFDESLADAIAHILREDDQTALDLGCGNGAYVRHLIAAGIDCRGYDGNPHTAEISDGLCATFDLTDQVPSGIRKADWVVCLEVAEHIPAEYESDFLDNLDYHNVHGVILSWAVPGQPGHGHVNTQPNDYVISQMESRGYTYDLLRSEDLRAASTLSWFANTIMVFTR